MRDPEFLLKRKWADPFQTNRGVRVVCGSRHTSTYELARLLIVEVTPTRLYAYGISYRNTTTAPGAAPATSAGNAPTLAPIVRPAHVVRNVDGT